MEFGLGKVLATLQLAVRPSMGIRSSHVLTIRVAQQLTQGGIDR